MRLMNNLVALLFPKRATAARIEQIDTTGIQKMYRPVVHDEYVALAPYSNRAIRAAVHEIKFHNNEHGAYLLGALLDRWVSEHVSEPAILVPVPLAAKRFRERGYNQVSRIAQHARAQHLTVDASLLIRTQNTKPQTELARTERQQNVRDAFQVPRRASARIRDVHILLLDDVSTTGATMRAACNALQRCRPASITCVAIAH